MTNQTEFLLRELQIEIHILSTNLNTYNSTVPDKSYWLTINTNNINHRIIEGRGKKKQITVFKHTQ